MGRISFQSAYFPIVGLGLGPEQALYTISGYYFSTILRLCLRILVNTIEGKP